jgi:hypothetical protein
MIEKKPNYLRPQAVHTHRYTRPPWIRLPECGNTKPTSIIIKQAKRIFFFAAVIDHEQTAFFAMRSGDGRSRHGVEKLQHLRADAG